MDKAWDLPTEDKVKLDWSQVHYWTGADKTDQGFSPAQDGWGQEQ